MNGTQNANTIKKKCMITVYRSNYRWWRKPHGSKCLPDVKKQHATLNWVKMCVFLMRVFLHVCVKPGDEFSGVAQRCSSLRKARSNDISRWNLFSVCGRKWWRHRCVFVCVATALKKTKQKKKTEKNNLSISTLGWMRQNDYYVLCSEEHTIWKKGFEVWTQTRVKVAFPLDGLSELSVLTGS